MSAKKDKSDKANTASSNSNPSASQAKPECFVIMPISDPDGYEPGHFRRVYEDLFVPACDDAGYRATRADEVRQTNLIHLDVLQKIIDSPMALCDLSSRNPNVLFELGLRQAFDKPVVLVQEVGTLPIFDINPLRYASYRREMLYRQVIEDQQEIANAIRETREAIGNNKSINSIVKLLSLTHGASLTNISEGEKESALLQVIMAEISNLRSEVRTLQPREDGSQGAAKALRIETRPPVELDKELREIREMMEVIDVVASEVRDLKSSSPDLTRWIDDLLPRVERALKFARDVRAVSAQRFLDRARAKLIEADMMNTKYSHISKNKEQGQAE